MAYSANSYSVTSYSTSHIIKIIADASITETADALTGAAIVRVDVVAAIAEAVDGVTFAVEVIVVGTFISNESVDTVSMNIRNIIETVCGFQEAGDTTDVDVTVVAESPILTEVDSDLDIQPPEDFDRDYINWVNDNLDRIKTALSAIDANFQNVLSVVFSHTWNVVGSVVLGNLPSMFISLFAGQENKLFRSRGVLKSGASATLTLHRRDATGTDNDPPTFANMVITTTPQNFGERDIALDPQDQLWPEVVAIDTSPQDLTYSLFLRANPNVIFA